MPDMRTSNQLGQDDGHEREELRVIGSTLIAPCDLGSAGASGWSATLTAAEFQDKMVLLGDQAVLERRTGGELIIGSCNPAGGMVPYKPSGTPIDDCTLSYHAAIVESGVTDMQLLPEAHLTKSPVPSFAPPRCSRRPAARSGSTRTRASARARSDSERRVSTEQVGVMSALASKARTRRATASSSCGATANATCSR